MVRRPYTREQGWRLEQGKVKLSFPKLRVSRNLVTKGKVLMRIISNASRCATTNTLTLSEKGAGEAYPTLGIVSLKTS